MDSLSLEIIALLTINMGGYFKTSYTIRKVVEWKYGGFPASDVMRSIRNKGWATYELIEQLEHYSVTEEGLRQIEENKHKTLEDVIVSFPTEVEFMQGLINNVLP